MKTLNTIALLLVIIGGLNWLLVGLFDWNLVAALFGSIPLLENLVYILVGIAALYALSFFGKLVKERRHYTHQTVGGEKDPLR